jgi:hypothetical protein
MNPNNTILILIITTLSACDYFSSQQNENIETEDTPAPSNKYLIVSGKSVGEINHLFNYNHLLNTFGSNRVEDIELSLPDALGTYTVTIVDKDTPSELIIVWKENLFHQKISYIEITRPESPYSTGNNIRIGTTLEMLEKINGKPITFFGFESDYAGMVINYNEGSLEGSRLGITLDKKNIPLDAVSKKLSGDIKLHSDDDIVQPFKTHILVSSMAVAF